MNSKTAIAACKTCALPVRVDFDDEGKIVEVFSVCGHVTKESAQAAQQNSEEENG